MLQESGFSPDLTVRESVGLIGALSGRHRRVDRVLGVVDLTRKADTRCPSSPAGRSGGWTSPPPCTATRADLPGRAHHRLWTSSPATPSGRPWTGCARTGSTIVLTTHYLEEAQQRADRIGLMHEGTFHREGTVAELTADPAGGHPLLAAPPALPRRRPSGRSTGPSTSRPSTCRRTCTACSAGRTTTAWSCGPRRPADPARRRLPRHQHDCHPALPRKGPPPCSPSLAAS